MVHDLMQNVAKADRRMRLIQELEVTLTAADKEAMRTTLTTSTAVNGQVNEPRHRARAHPAHENCEYSVQLIARMLPRSP